MGSPGVRQLEFLSGVFGTLIAEFEPAAVVVLGCATGNGFEHVRPERVRRLVGLDINREYLDLCRERYAKRIPGLELTCEDIVSFELEPRSMDFAHAALFLEYVDPGIVIEKASRWLKSCGIFATVLQLPSESCGTVSDTGFTSLKALEPVITLVEPGHLERILQRYGFSRVKSARETLGSGKEFFVGVYRLEAS
jgi:ubiquinone/menaquinone biosynthesis C-methylase UbiE